MIILNYRNILIKRKYGSLEDIKNSRLLTQIYLDQFFITNKFYTFSMSILYMFGMVIIFIIIRYMYINNITQIIPQDSLYTPILQIISGYIIISITLILYRSFLIILFKKEINKLYIYCKQFLLSYNIQTLLEFSLGKYIFGHLYVITYRLGTLTYKYPRFPTSLNTQDWHDANIEYLFDDEVNYDVRNKIYISCMYKMQDISLKYIYIQKVFRFLAYIFRYIYKHIHKLYQPFPYFLLILIFLMELYNKQLKYIYIVLFIILIMKIKRDLYVFIQNRNGSIDFALNNYFYKNKLNYEKQRIYFYSKDNVDIVQVYNSMENHALFQEDELIEYMYDKNFIREYFYSNREKGIYRRFFAIIGCLIIAYYLLFYNHMGIKDVISLVPTGIMMYAHYYTYYIPWNTAYKENIDLEYFNYVYNRNYNIIFWIFAIIQGYIFWLLLLKPEIIFMDTEVLLELPFNLIKIIKIYTTEEKIMYLFQYFEYNISTMDIDKEYIRHIIRLIDYHDLIDNNVKLQDLQVYVKLLIDNYNYYESFEKTMKEIMVEIYTSEKVKVKENSWYTLLKNVLIISSITSTLLNINNLWIIIIKINTPKDVYIIVKYMYIKIVENKLTYETFMNYIIKIFKW
jgi:hypothetical protein